MIYNYFKLKRLSSKFMWQLVSIKLALIICLTSCNTEGGGNIKLTSDERFMIDTSINSAIAKMTVDLEKWCKDSTPIFRQRYIDSLVIVREQEVLKQLPVQNSF